MTSADKVAERFSTYVLPGRISDPLRALAEGRDAAKVGLGGIWLSERYATKEPAVIGGALAIACPELRIGGTFYAHMRHPIVTASIANTMQAYTGNRFTLVLARASPEFFDGFGVPTLTLARLGDTSRILRSLWNGEVVDYSGSVGTYRGLRLSDRYEGLPPPIVFTAIGPKALAFAGEHCDGVLLHPLLTVDAVARSAAACRKAAATAGKDPAHFRVVANVIVAPDLSAEKEAAVVGGRAVTYLQAALGDIIAQVNQWDSAPLARLRSYEKFASLDSGIASRHMTREQLVEASQLLPPEWLEHGVAAGSAAQCADRLCSYLQAGADEILLHGAAPSEMTALMSALRDKF